MMRLVLCAICILLLSCRTEQKDVTIEKVDKALEKIEKVIEEVKETNPEIRETTVVKIVDVLEQMRLILKEERQGRTQPLVPDWSLIINTALAIIAVLTGNKLGGYVIRKRNSVNSQKEVK